MSEDMCDGRSINWIPTEFEVVEDSDEENLMPNVLPPLQAQQSLEEQIDAIAPLEQPQADLAMAVQQLNAAYPDLMFLNPARYPDIGDIGVGAIVEQEAMQENFSLFRGRGRFRTRPIILGHARPPRGSSGAGPSGIGNALPPRGRSGAGPSSQGNALAPRGRSIAGPSGIGNALPPRGHSGAGPSSQGNALPPRGRGGRGLAAQENLSLLRGRGGRNAPSRGHGEAGPAVRENAPPRGRGGGNPPRGHRAGHGRRRGRR